MNLILRLFWIGAKAFRRSSLDLADTGRISLHVLPNDLDFNFHMNNGRFLSVMDLGRVDLIIRVGMLKTMRAEGWYPVVGAIHMTFRRSLHLFQLYDVETSVVGWDEKWIYITQRIESNGQEVALAVMKTLLMSKHGKVSSEKLAEALGRDVTSPEIPTYVFDLMKTNHRSKAE